MSNAENLMTVNEVAARWKLGHLAVRRRILDGKLKAVRLGRFVRIPLSSVQAYERTEFQPFETTTTPAITTPPQSTVDYSREARQQRRQRVVAVCGDAVRSGKVNSKGLEKMAADAGIQSEAGTPLIAETIRLWVRQADRTAKLEEAV